MYTSGDGFPPYGARPSLLFFNSPERICFTSLAKEQISLLSFTNHQ